MKENKVSFRNPAGSECLVSTSFHNGYVKSTACKISKALGCNISEAWRGQYPTTFDWHKVCGSVVFHIYDYKQGPKNSGTVLDYHIGTKCPEDTAIIVEVLKGLGLDAYIEK